MSNKDEAPQSPRNPRGRSRRHWHRGEGAVARPASFKIHGTIIILWRLPICSWASFCAVEGSAPAMRRPPVVQGGYRCRADCKCVFLHILLNIGPHGRLYPCRCKTREVISLGIGGSVKMKTINLVLVSACMMALAAPVAAKVGFGTETETTLGNSGKPAGEGQGGEGTTTETTTGPKGQLKQEECSSPNCETVVTDQPGKNR
jgi:hypothetical protein